MIRIAIATLGCKTNAFESSVIIDQFDAGDCTLVPFENEADVYIINTCTVTNRTDFKSRNLIRKALARKNADPNVKVVVTGCFAQRSYDEIRLIGDVDLVIDNQNKQDIAKLLKSGEERFGDIMQAKEFCYRPVKNMVEHSRAFQKIQDGCDFRCTYCAVPDARGHNRSARLSDVISQAELFARSGYKEIVLGGVNLGLYKDGEHGLADVVEALQQISGLELIRLSSIEPQLLTSELLHRIQQCDKLCPHFHIPLQSGCDSVLQRMGRHYDSSEFRHTIENVLDIFPDAAIGLDVITGFPGESEEEFSMTLSFLQKLDIAYLHVFSYSKRKDTPAATMPDQVSKQVSGMRSGILTKLSETKKQTYTLKLITKGNAIRGVCESVSEGLGTFLSDHYIRGYTDGTPTVGEICKITPQSVYRDGVK